MYATSITVRGNVVDEVALKTVANSGIARVQFRVASTERRKDRESGQWVDGNSLFLNVTFWREFAENVAKSLKKGDPVVVTGRLYSRSYVKDERNCVSYEIDADSIGHDLSRGVGRFERRQRSVSGSVILDADGLPARPDDQGYELIADALDEIAPDGSGRFRGDFSPVAGNGQSAALLTAT